MYKIISGLNSFIGEEIIPNPFEFISDNAIIVSLFSFCIGSWLLHKISFAMCGIFYNKGEAPVLGSFGYLVAYSLNVLAIIIISKMFNSFFIIGIVYIMVVICTFILLYKIKQREYMP